MKASDYSALKNLIEAAAQGVSADNGQPWSFSWRDSQLTLRLDSRRADSFFDRRQFAAFFGLGSVLENLAIASAHFGYRADIEVLYCDIRQSSPMIARVYFSSGKSGPFPLYQEIFRRSTNRRPYETTPVPPDVRAGLTAPFDGTHSIRLAWIDNSEEIRHVASLTAAADRIRFDFSEPAIHEDFFGRLRYSEPEAQTTRDGLWIDCLEAKPPDRLALQLLGKWPVARFARYLGVARVFAKQTMLLFGRTPLVACLIGRNTMRDPNAASAPTDELFLHGGRLCQHMWLLATRCGLACQPMAVLPLFFAQHALFGRQGFPGEGGTRVGRLKEEFHRRFGLGSDEHLLMVLRLGYAPPPSARSFRRPPDQLLTIDDDSPLVSV